MPTTYYSVADCSFTLSIYKYLRL